MDSLDSPSVDAASVDSGSMDSDSVDVDSVDIAVGSRGPSLSTAIGLIIALLGFLLGSKTIADNSFLTHLTTGDLIRSLNDVPTTDPYTYTAPGEAWTIQSWFASVVYSLLSDVGGGNAIRALNGALVASIATMAWRLTASARPLLSRLLVIMPILVIGGTQWSPRPLLFGLLGFVVVLSALQGQCSARWLVPMMWVWVNTHGSFPMAFVAIGAFGLGQMIDDGSWRLPRHELEVFLWACVGTASSILNPLGIKLLVFPVQLLAKREALNGVGEWQPPNFDSLPELVYLALLVAFVVAAKTGVKWRLMIPGLIFSVAGLLAMRNVAMASLVLLIVIAPALQLRGTLRGHEQGLVPRGLALVALCGVMLGLVSITRSEPLSSDLYPVEEIAWLDERGLIAQPGVNIIQRDFVGNYLHYRYGLDARVFVDDRFDFFPQQVLDDHLTFLKGGDYGEALERYDANVVLWRNTGGFAAWLEASSDWDVVQTSDDWLVALPASRG